MRHDHCGDQARGHKGKMEGPPYLPQHIGSYMAAAQAWFDNAQVNKYRAYLKLYTELLEIWLPREIKLATADRKTVLDSVADKTGKFIDEMDKELIYIHQEAEEITQARKAMKEYYEAVRQMCDVQLVLMAKTARIQEKLNNDKTFLEIIRHVQLMILL